MNARASRAPPRSALGVESGGVLSDEPLLLIPRQHHHASGFIVVQGCENSAVDSKVGVTHVCALEGFGQAEHDSTEVFGIRHDVLSVENDEVTAHLRAARLPRAVHARPVRQELIGWASFFFRAIVALVTSGRAQKPIAKM